MMCNLSEVVEQSGIKKGEERINSLYKYLIRNGKNDDLERAMDDPIYRHELMEKYITEEGDYNV